MTVINLSWYLCVLFAVALAVSSAITVAPGGLPALCQYPNASGQAASGNSEGHLLGRWSFSNVSGRAIVR